MNTQAVSFSGDEHLTNYVECIFQGQKYKIRSKYFVLTAGGIENSRILLWSAKNSNLIGKNSEIEKEFSKELSKYTDN